MKLLGEQLDKDIVRDISSFGSAVFYVWVMIVAYILRPRFAFALMAGLVVVYIIGYGLKALIKTPRPDHGRVRKPETFFEKWDASTFPSVHAMHIATLAAFFLGRFGMIADIVLAIMIIGVAFSRMALRRHRFTDVVVGTALGLGIGLMMRFVL